MSIRMFAAPLAIALSTVFLAAAAVPAQASDVSCAATPGQIRTLAQTAPAGNAAKALKLVSTGEKLCAADNRFEAGKKFAAAAKLLGTELAALSTAPTAQ
ncbi:hypothetical protein [Sandarakinorhabdus sp.]|uniref:hypothetical protein n=1 Tax=Sandarakinorhabdus sp. TaxID=1916663 RepID=UPI00286D99DB|nr:hypothetical protein [Sandarakinorhabdus sp.]